MKRVSQVVRLLQAPLLIGVSLLAFDAAQADFLATKTMKRHAHSGPPPVPSPMELLTAEPAHQFRRGNVAMSPGVEESVAKAARPVKLMAGYNGDGNIFSTGFQARGMTPGIMLLVGARYDRAGNYDDGNGNRVRFGYQRDTQQAVFNWKLTPSTNLRLIGIRDMIRDDKQPHYPMDVIKTERLVGKALIDHVLDHDVVKKISFEFAGKKVHRAPNNFDLRTPPNPMMRMRLDVNRKILSAKSTVKMDLAGWQSNLIVDGAYDNHDAQRYLNQFLSATRYPDVTRTNVGIAFDGKRRFGKGEVQAGLRYDYVNADPDGANQMGNVPGGMMGAPAWNMSPAMLYNLYYGAGNFSAIEHNLSARLRYTHDLFDGFKVYGDASRLVRSPDNAERYTAVGHPQGGRRWVGNPFLNPEAHHKAEIGFSWTGAHYASYGRLKPAADNGFSLDAMQIKASAYVDWVQDFVTLDRARMQAGIRQGDGAIISRNVDAMLAGVTLDARWNATRNLAFGVNAAYLWGQNTTDDRPLYQIAPFEANLLVDYHDYLGDIGTWNVGARVRMVANQTRVDANRATGLGMDQGTGKGFTTLDFYAGVQIANRISLKAGVNNVFDTQYQEHLTGSHIASPNRMAENAPGRTFFVRSIINF